MPHDFDEPRSLSGIHASAWEGRKGVYRHGQLPDNFDDVIPMWVADMDYSAAPPIRAALAQEVDRGYLGYFGNPGPASEAVSQWIGARHGWTPDPKAVRFTNGVIAGLVITLESFTDPGDGIILFPPVYHAFARRIEALDRKVVESQLVLEDGAFRMDLETLQEQLTGSEKAVVFCSPHNPGGRLWSAEEIRALVDFCVKNDLMLISDEIHMDLTFPGATHHATAAVAPDCMDRFVFLGAASKAFNIAGGETGFAIIPDTDLRARFDRNVARYGGPPNRFGMAMTTAAFTEGGGWLDNVCTYLAENFALWQDRIGKLPGVEVMAMSSTYLAWADFTATGMDEAELERRIGVEARLAVSPGLDFGSGGGQCRRFNLAKPRPVLIEAIERMEAAFADLQ
jgi:cystathionine beta-lyase